MSAHSLKDAKSALRQALRSARHTLGTAERLEADARIAAQVRALPVWQTARRWFVYLSEADEVATRALVGELLGRPGTAVYAPVIVSREQMEARRLTSFADLLPGRYDIPAPLHGDLLQGDVDAVLTPGLGFTRQGERMGLGAGYYDRWFALHPAGVRIALAYDCQIVGALPTEATDCPVDLLVTASGVIPCRPEGRP